MCILWVDFEVKKELVLLIVGFMLFFYLWSSGLLKTVEYECIRDSECFTTGCSGQVCSNRKMITTCEMQPEYYCLEHTSCKCIDYKCQWEKTQEFEDCMKEGSSGRNINIG